MTVNIPTVGHPLSAKATELASLKTLATATTNTQVAAQYSQRIVQLQREIVHALIASNELPASAILSSMTFRAADTN